MYLSFGLHVLVVVLAGVAVYLTDYGGVPFYFHISDEPSYAILLGCPLLLTGQYLVREMLPLRFTAYVLTSSMILIGAIVFSGPELMKWFASFHDGEPKFVLANYWLGLPTVVVTVLSLLWNELRFKAQVADKVLENN